VRVEKLPHKCVNASPNAQLLRVDNGKGTICEIATYGATLLSFKVDRDVELIARFDQGELPAMYGTYAGAAVGRVANRVGKAQFELDGKVYKVKANVPPNSLHGGAPGFHDVDWVVKSIFTTDKEVGVELEYVSKDGEGGYPGTLTVCARYSLSISDDPELGLLYSAELTNHHREHLSTVVNICNHAYWNLNGKTDTILDHYIQTYCPSWVSTDGECIPDGKLPTVTGTPLDFCGKPRKIGDRINDIGKEHGENFGYDYCVCALPPSEGTGHEMVAPKVTRKFGDITVDMKTIVVLSNPEGSGRKMTVSTNQPGCQIYTGNYLPGKLQHSCVALETQHLPDSPNQQGNPLFPSVVLRPGEIYRHGAVFAFSKCSSL